MTLRVSDLAVERGGRLLFRDLTFDALPGDVVAVYGRNGAGKSSLLRVLAGLLEPLGGSVSLSSPLVGEVRQKGGMGGDLTVPPTASHALGTSPAQGWGEDVFHFCGHLDAVKPAMTVRETLAFWAALYGGDGLDTALRDWMLTGLADLPGQYLSAGQKRRVALARLSLAPRPIWLLDEPSAALDASAKALLIARGEAHTATGGIIVVASHEPLWPGARALNLDAHAKAAA
jgi:heme exporter protein A